MQVTVIRILVDQHLEASEKGLNEAGAEAFVNFSGKVFDMVFYHYNPPVHGIKLNKCASEVPKHSLALCPNVVSGVEVAQGERKNLGTNSHILKVQRIINKNEFL